MAKRDTVKKKFATRPRIKISLDSTSNDSDSSNNSKDDDLLLPPCQCSSSIPSDIIAGKKARKHEFPWIIRLGRSIEAVLRSHCGGSIISPNFAITAAHCVSDSYTSSFCMVGVNSLREFADGREGFRVDIEKIIVHEDYEVTPYGPLNDIALLKLNTTLDLGLSNVDAIRLPPRGRLYNGGNGMLAGWGVTRQNSKVTPDDLMKKKLKIWPRKNCNLHMHKTFPRDSLLCVSDQSGAHCFGDSGGPLMVKKNGIYELAGLVSFGPICKCIEDLCICGGEPCKSGYYVSIPYHLDWIKRHTFDEPYLWTVDDFFF